MTDSADAERAAPVPRRPAPAFGHGVNFLGLIVVAFCLVVQTTRGGVPWWAVLAGGIALAAWAVADTVSGRGRLGAALVMVLVGSVAVLPTQGLLVVPVVIGLVMLQAAAVLAIWTAGVVASISAAEISAGAVTGGASVSTLGGVAAALMFGVFGGLSRRHFRVAEIERQRAVEQRQRARLLAEKARAARDIHDVLAHSLGGLVVQLDAVDALLEAGREPEARVRASSARALAVDGLAEARRAVVTLREGEGVAVVSPPAPGEAVRPASLAGGLQGLVDAHREFGAVITVSGALALDDLDPAHAEAIVAATREALSNARKHAPGAPVAIMVDRSGGAVVVEVRNHMRPAGHGLIGMRERFAPFADAAVIDVGRSGDDFVVAMRVSRNPVDACDAPRNPGAAKSGGHL